MVSFIFHHQISPDLFQEEFFDQYEKGLRCLVSNFKAQASEQGNGSVAQLKKELQDAQQIIHDLLVKFDKVPATSSIYYHF